VARYAVRLPDRDQEIGCDSESEVREALLDYEARSPGSWLGVSVHELLPDANVGADRPVHNFVGYDGPATIVQGERSFDVHCHFDLDLAGSLPSWSGTYDAADPPYPDVGAAVLQLADGSQARVNLRSLSVGSATPMRGEFVGSGAPPR